ncbi:MFS transporter [Streptomyces sp. NP160]|uniref:MFS transporter n=1 Tax=Streptomyces sp. NP160 TaxID=2586637 RepID=UPI001118A1FA|nr:MFS transporter [Streptomyces sp. NP160]TNM68421.1 MFS transporter [Streptomyces sp. NP160]
MSLTASFAPYAELHRAAGTPYLVTAFSARLPITLVPVSVLAAVTSGTGSVAVGGLAAAATSVGEAVGGPTLGALADRLARRGGQRPVLLAAAAVNVAALLVVATGAGLLPVPLLLLATFAAGFAMPPIGSFSRARWMRRTPALVPTAMAGESAADEVAYVLGPALAGVVALVGSPATSLLVAAALVAVAVPAFALHPSATTPTGSAAADGGGARTGSRASGELFRRLAVVIAAAVGMGLFFGGGQTTLTAAAQEAGSIGAGGLLVAAMGVGSAFTALAMVAVPERVSLSARLATAAGVLLVGIATMAVSLALTPSLLALAAATALAGLAVGPAMVTITSMAAERSTAASGATAMTLVGSGIVVGVGSGAAAAGWLAEHHGALHATGVLAFAAAVLLAAAVAAGRGRARRSAEPVVQEPAA